MILRPALNATVESPIEEKEWNVKSRMWISFMQNAKILMLNIKQKWQSSEKNENIWLKNQHPENWISKIISDALQKIIRKPPENEGKKVQLRGQKSPAKDVKPFFSCSNEVISAFNCSQNWKKMCELKTIFTTRKLSTFLPSLKSGYDCNLKSHLVNGLSCCGCSSTYVGQTCRHFAKKISEHQKTDSLVGQHVLECCGALTEMISAIISKKLWPEKLCTLVDTSHNWIRGTSTKVGNKHWNFKCRMHVQPKNFWIAMRATLYFGSIRKYPIQNSHRKCSF